MATIIQEGSMSAGQDSALFSDLKFYLSARTPQRSYFIQTIKANGGTIARSEKAPNTISIIDDVLEDPPTGGVKRYSYKFLEQSLRAKKLLDVSTFEVRPRGQRSSGAKGSTSSKPAVHRQGRNKFSTKDDLILLRTISSDPNIKLAGNAIYKQIAERYPQHTWHGWRGRWYDTMRQSNPDPQRHLAIVEQTAAREGVVLTDDEKEVVAGSSVQAPAPKPKKPVRRSAEEEVVIPEPSRPAPAPKPKKKEPTSRPDEEEEEVTMPRPSGSVPKARKKEAARGTDEGEEMVMPSTMKPRLQSKDPPRRTVFAEDDENNIVPGPSYRSEPKARKSASPRKPDTPPHGTSRTKRTATSSPLAAMPSSPPALHKPADPPSILKPRPLPRPTTESAPASPEKKSSPYKMHGAAPKPRQSEPTPVLASSPKNDVSRWRVERRVPAPTSAPRDEGKAPARPSTPSPLQAFIESPSSSSFKRIEPTPPREFSPQNGVKRKRSRPNSSSGRLSRDIEIPSTPGASPMPSPKKRAREASPELGTLSPSPEPERASKRHKPDIPQSSPFRRTTLPEEKLDLSIPLPEDDDSNASDSGDEDVDALMDSLARKYGLGLEEVILAIERTGGEKKLIEVVLESLRKGKGLPDIRGVWTEEEDRVCRAGNDARLLMELEERRGDVEARVQWLEVYRAAGERV